MQKAEKRNSYFEGCGTAKKLQVVAQHNSCVIKLKNPKNHHEAKSLKPPKTLSETNKFKKPKTPKKIKECKNPNNPNKNQLFKETPGTTRKKRNSTKLQPGRKTRN